MQAAGVSKHNSHGRDNSVQSILDILPCHAWQAIFSDEIVRQRAFMPI